MKKATIIFSVIFFFMKASAQIEGSMLLGLVQGTTIDINNTTNPIEGSLVYNIDDNKVYVYNGSAWGLVSGTNENWTISGNNQYSSVSGNVGIGNNAPNFKLSIANSGNGGVWQQFSNADTQATGNDGFFVGIDSDENAAIWNAENTALRFVTNNTEKMRISNSGNVGIGTPNPSTSLDVNGQARVRNIPLGTDTDKILTTDTDGNIRKIDQRLANKSYVQTFKGNKSFGNGNAVLLNLFPEVTIQANKKIKLSIYVPTRHDGYDWGGLYININARVNGTWYNLGNCGYDGNAMQSGASSINSYSNTVLLDFIGNLTLSQNTSYTVQFELTARSYSGTTRVNQNHDINRTANNLNSRGALQTWASDQNYCHIIIEEKNR